MDELKKLLGEELFKQVSEKIGSKKLLVQEKDGDFVPRKRIDEEKAKLKPLEAELATAKSELEASKSKITELEEAKKKEGQTTEEKLTALTEELNNLKAQNEEKDKKLTIGNIRGALRAEFLSHGANEKYIDDLIRRCEKDGSIEHLEVVNGKIKDFEELHKPIFENNPEMYGEFKIEGSPSGGGDGNDVNFGASKEMERYKELFGKETLSPKESLELSELAVKIKEEKLKEKKET